MAKENVKEIILNCAKELFYKKGYEQTTLAEIGKNAGITYVGVTYHFKNKINIANMIFDEMSRKVKNICTLYLYEKHSGKYDLLMGIALECRMLREMYKKDEKYRRFYLEYMALGNISCTEINYKFHDLVNISYNLNMSANDVKRSVLLTQATNYAITKGYYDGIFEYTFDEYVDQIIYCTFDTFFDDKKFIWNIIEQSKIEFAGLDYDLHPNFEVSCKYGEI